MKTGRAEAQSVTLLLPFPVFGAAEDYCAILAEGLLSRGWAVTVLLPAAVEPAEGISSVASLGANIVPLLGSVLNNPVRLRAVLKRLSPSRIVHINHFFLPGVAAAIGARSGPTIVTVHTPALQVNYSFKGRSLARWVTPKVSAWIALSERNANLLVHAMPATKDHIRVVSPGLPPERFESVEPAGARRAARARLGLTDDAFVIGTVGRMARQKRHDVLIRAAAIALTRIRNLQVVVIGEGELRPHIEAAANAQLPGRVMLAGNRDDVPELLPAFDVFCLTSDFEGLPFALLEAMAMGLPIVATNVQGAGEAVNDGAEGLLVPAGNAVLISEAIVRLAEDRGLAGRLGQTARRRFLKDFTADTMVHRTIGVYEDLIN